MLRIFGNLDVISGYSSYLLFLSKRHSPLKGFLLISKVQYHEEEEEKDAKEEEVKEEDEVKRIKR